MARSRDQQQAIHAALSRKKRGRGRPRKRNFRPAKLIGAAAFGGATIFLGSKVAKSQRVRGAVLSTTVAGRKLAKSKLPHGFTDPIKSILENRPKVAIKQRIQSLRAKLQTSMNAKKFELDALDKVMTGAKGSTKGPKTTINPRNKPSTQSLANAQKVVKAGTKKSRRRKGGVKKRVVRKKK